MSLTSQILRSPLIKVPDKFCTTKGEINFHLIMFVSRLCFSIYVCLPRWSRVYHTCHWIRGSRVQTRQVSMDFFRV